MTPSIPLPWVKRLVVLGLSSALLAAAAGCGALNLDSKSRAEETAGLQVGFIQAETNSGWREANTRDIQAAFADAQIELVYSDAEGRQDTQIAALQALIAQKVDVIVFSPVVDTGWDEVLADAKAAHIPVVLTDRMIDSPNTTLYAAFLGSDFTTQGERAGQWALDRFRDADLVRIVEIQGTSGSAPANDRAMGFRTVISGRLSFEFVMSQSGDFTRAGGRAVMEEALATQPEIDLVYAHNDEMGLGAIEAIEAYNIAPGEDISIVTVDGTADGLRALADGDINFIVESSPLVGKQLVDLATALATGAEVDRRVLTNETTFTREDALEVLPQRDY